MSPTSPVEDRLAAALAARADQVTADDLGAPADLRAPRRTSQRRAWVRAGLAAAVAAGLVAAGTAVWQHDRALKPVPLITPAPPPSADRELVIGGDPLVPAGERVTAPVPAWGGEVTAWVRARRLAVRASSDDGSSGTGNYFLADGDRDPSLSPHVLLGTGGSAGVVVHVARPSGYELRPFTVLLESGRLGAGRAGTLVDSRGVAEVVRADGAPPFRTGLADHVGEQHRVLSWVGDDGRGYTLVVPPTQTHRETRDLAGPVEVWEWTLDGGVLRPARLSDTCAAGGAIVDCGAA